MSDTIIANVSSYPTSITSNVSSYPTVLTSNITTSDTSITSNVSAYPTAITANLSTYTTSILTNFVETTLNFLDGAGLNIENTFSQDNHFLQDVSIDGDLTGVDSITFDTAAIEANAVGKLKWNDEDGTLDLGLKGGNVTLQIGQEMVVRAVNKTDTNLLEANYQVARIRTEAEGGSQGQRLAIVLAQADNDADSVDTLGIVTENIANNQEGFITTFGIVRGIDTTGDLQGEAWKIGDVLYLSPTIAGRLTKVKPAAPNPTVIVGFVVHTNKNQGKIFVKVNNGYELDELHNVNISNLLANNDVLTYNSILGVWRNTQSLDVGSLFTDTFRIYSGANYCQINAPALTTNISFTLPNTSGTIATNNTAVMLTGTQSVTGLKTFNSQIRSTGQTLNTADSVVTRELGDVRYGTYSDILTQATVSFSTTFSTLLSVTLPVGLYQLEAFMSSSHTAGVGCQIRLGSSDNIKVGITDDYGRPLVSPITSTIISEDYNNLNPNAFRAETVGVEFRRTISGVIQVLTPNTIISLDYAQAVLTPATQSTARARAYIVAKPII